MRFTDRYTGYYGEGCYRAHGRRFIKRLEHRHNRHVANNQLRTETMNASDKAIYDEMHRKDRGGHEDAIDFYPETLQRARDLVNELRWYSNRNIDLNETSPKSRYHEGFKTWGDLMDHEVNLLDECLDALERLR